MRRTSGWSCILLGAACAALAGAACAPGQGTVFVSVDSDQTVRGIDHFHVKVELGAGGPAVTTDLAPPSRPVELPPPQTFSLVFGATHKGAFTLSVDAIDRAGLVLASGRAVGDVEPSQSTSLSVILGNGSPSDGGVDAGSDGGAEAASGADAGSGGDAGATLDSATDDATPSSDAATGADLGCAQSVEDCTNNIDDNCDGLVDCADPQCGAYRCAPLPSGNGWTIVAYNGSDRPACPTLFAGASTMTATNVSATPATCGCTCGNTAPATCQGTFAYNAFAGGLYGSNYPAQVAVLNGKCQSFPNDNFASNLYFKGIAIGVATQPGSCSATGAVRSKPPVNQTPGETCAVAAVGGGCAALSSCAPIVPSGYQLCSMHDGAVSCPTGLVAVTAFTGVSDTRSCGGCACGTQDLGCAVNGFSFWPNGDCTGSPVFYFGASCTPAGANGGTKNSGRAALTTNGRNPTDCVVTAGSSPTGGVAPTGPVTLCCLP